MSGRAIFLDRDGTLIEPRHYPSLPEHLRLFDGIVSELSHLQRAGFRLVVITNQSGIARGYFGEAELRRMHEHLTNELGWLGVWLDGIYHCPHHPEGIIPTLSVDCDCRKPEPGMLLRAAADLDLDLSRSWFVGDILDDVEAGKRAGCRTILVDLDTESPPSKPERRPELVARDTVHALKMIRAIEGCGPSEKLDYLPASWRTMSPESVGSESMVAGGLE